MDLAAFGLTPMMQLVFGAAGVLLVCALATLAELAWPARPRHHSVRETYLGRDFVFCLLATCYVVAIQLGQQCIRGLVPAAALSAPTWGTIARDLFLVFVVHDFLMYWLHRLLHTKHAWVTHKWHHAIQDVNWLSGIRGSLVEFVVDTIPSFGLYLFFPSIVPWLLPYAFYTQFFIHLNTRLPSWFPAGLLVTPWYHRAHHALDERLHNTNFSTLWVFWDRWFGTLAPLDGAGDSFALGLGEDPFELRRAVGL